MFGMSCLFICEPFTNKRTKIENVDLKLSVANFKDVVYQYTEIKTRDQELVYCGKCLSIEENTLESYNIENQVTIFVLKKFPNKMTDIKSPISVDEIKNLLTKARSQLFRLNIRNVLKDKEALKKLLPESEFINFDPMTVALMQSPTMFLTVIDTADADCIATNYQPFANLLKLVVQWVEGTERKLQTSEDDDENDDNLYDSYFAQSDISLNDENLEQEPENSRNQQIPEPNHQQVPANNRSLPHTSSETHAQISASDLANALSFASFASGQPSSTNQILSSEQVRLACEQVQALGITDESLIIRALSLSGGNIEAAINLIFEDIIQ